VQENRMKIDRTRKAGKNEGNRRTKGRVAKPHTKKWMQRRQRGDTKGNPANDATVPRSSSQLQPAMVQYLTEASEHLQRLANSQEPRGGDDGDIEDARVVASNVVKEIRDQIHAVVCDPVGSRTLEVVVEYLAIEDLNVILLPALFTGDVRTRMNHRFASHVLEKVIPRIGGEQLDALVNVLEEEGALVAIADDRYGSHVLRTILQTLAHADLAMAARGSLEGDWILPITPDVSISKSERQLFVRIAKRFLREESLLPLAKSPCASSVLQFLITGLQLLSSSLSRKISQHILGHHMENFDGLVKDNAGSRFLEVALMFMEGEQLLSLYQTSVRGKVVSMSKERNENFVLQRIILRAGLSSDPLVLGILNELKDSMGELLHIGRTGVVVALANACEKASDPSCTKLFTKFICTAVGATGENAKDLVGLLLFFGKERLHRWRTWAHQRYEGACMSDAELGGPKVSILGSLMVQAILRFNHGNSRLANDSVASLSKSEILALCRDASGSRVLEAFLTGNAGESSKSRLGAYLLGQLPEIVKDPSGSRIVEKVFVTSDYSRRRQMVEELLPHLESLQTDQYAKFVLRFCRVSEYLARKETWLQQEEKRSSKRKALNDLLKTIENFDTSDDPGRGGKNSKVPELQNTRGSAPHDDGWGQGKQRANRHKKGK